MNPGLRGVFLLSFALVGCGGGLPLLHPAQTLPLGDVRAVGGVSANVALGSAADDLRTAREIATRGDPGPNNAPYAKGALVAAAIAPGIAPYFAVRVGIGHQLEAGLAYTGRDARVDVRRSFDLGSTGKGNYALSIGLGGSAALYGRQQGSDLPNVDLGALHGYGADLPVVVGWRSNGGLYQVWGGARAGFERDVVESLTSEPKNLPGGPERLEATRFWGGAALGVATGFRHVHVALELDLAYQSITGSFGGAEVTVRGLTLAPASAVWWTF